MKIYIIGAGMGSGGDLTCDGKKAIDESSLLLGSKRMLNLYADRRTAELLKRFTDPEALRRFEAERYLFGRMKADCSVPLGVYAEFQGEAVTIRALFGARRFVKKGPAAEYRRLCDEICGEGGIV